MNKKQRKRPLLPDGSELYIGFVIAAIIGLVMVRNDYPMWSYLLAVVVAFLGCVYGIQIWSEDDRQYWKAMQLKDELTGNLDRIVYFARQVRNTTAQKYVTTGVGNARLIIAELLKQKSTRMYGGLSQLAPHVRRMLMIEEYVDIQDFPSKAGSKRPQLMQEAEQGFEGFGEEMARMLERVNAGDVFSLSTNAVLLRSLRDLLGQNKQETKS